MRLLLQSILLCSFFLLFVACTPKANLFELTPMQSMLMIGKGQGQDATINPYAGQMSIAKVKNLGNSTFEVRIQRDGQLISITEIQVNEKKEFILQSNEELYFDTEAKTKASIVYRKYRKS